MNYERPRYPGARLRGDLHGPSHEGWTLAEPFTVDRSPGVYTWPNYKALTGFLISPAEH